MTAGQHLCSFGIVCTMNWTLIPILERHDASTWVTFVVGGCAALAWRALTEMMRRRH